VLRVGIVGGGVAGALLAWRLVKAGCEVEVHTAPVEGDATAASGGLVRGFEPEAAACRLAAESLVELRADFRDVAGYREVGSTYLLAPGADPAESVEIVDAVLPGSLTVRTGAEPFRGAATTAIVERRAGYFSPARLRAAVLARLGEVVRREPVERVELTPAVRLAGGRTARYDVVVVASGPWTPELLQVSGLVVDGLRTKQIQYTLCDWRCAGLGAFVDEVTGLYGRPDERGFLLGLPGQRWHVDPADVLPDPELRQRMVARARERLGLPDDCALRTVAAADCYTDPPGLALREVVPGICTFTGGSGGAAKTALAASRRASAVLDELYQ
jgi:glycine/D-amino acid oxidase-like deaminating enzyme